MADRLLSALERVQSLAWRAGLRLQWPCWLLAWAWDQQAVPGPARETEVRRG